MYTVVSSAVVKTRYKEIICTDCGHGDTNFMDMSDNISLGASIDTKI